MRATTAAATARWTADYAADAADAAWTAWTADTAAGLAADAAVNASAAAAEYAAEVVRAGSKIRAATWMDAAATERAWQADQLARMLEP